MKKRTYVAMIPARMNSQRIPKKNIRYLAGKPLINYPIDLAKQCKRFTSIWVNTESGALGEYVTKQGVNFHKRPEELSSNTATNRDFVYEFLKKHECDYVVMVNPTSPTLRAETLFSFLDYLDSHDFDTVMSVCSEKTETYYMDKPVNFSISEKINSQFLEPVHKIVWALTAWKKDYFIMTEDSGANPIFGGKLGLFTIPKDETADLDTEEDWRIAEGILRSRETAEEKKYLLI